MSNSTDEVIVRLSPEVAKGLRKLAVSSGRTLESFLEDLAKTISEAGLDPDQDPARKWLEWCAKPRSIQHIADDDRDSIYSGRGE